ncbi:unnamed protein product [Mytilus edulis]|uniref:Reverse transcriptase domain-containing protein n=1 Tax=Mytilus edulis TaxID=6550 RepID=A0A8S3TIJ7_MYTED|nr:unnamed protein product [Mytilus edulis]
MYSERRFSLFMACQKNHVEIVKLLLKNKADVNKCTTEASPLCFACQTNQVEIVNMLLEYKADKVDGPSTWVSPVVFIPKKNSEIRLCIDMRRPNEAVVREWYPIPTVEKMLQDLNQSRVYSKLDIKLAFREIELSQKSRDITAFITHQGLCRYKHLMFGISCTPEMYNKIIHQVLEGLPGVNSINDDIIVHGKSDEEHNPK